MKKSFFVLALIALISFSCSEDKLQGTQQEVIRLTSAIAPMHRGTSLDQQSTQIVNGRKVGVTITGATESHDNVAWVAGDNGELMNSGETLFWGNENITIYAYHPFNAYWGVNDVERFTVKNDQSETGYLDSDLLWTTQTASQSSAPVALTFTHKLSKINVTLTSEDIVDLSNATIQICNVKPSVGINLHTGELAQTLTSELIDIKAGVTMPNSYTAAAIIAPQTQSAGVKFIEILLGGESFVYTLPEEKEFKSGCSYSYTLKLSRKPLEVSVVSENILDWNNETLEGETSNEYTLRVTQAGILPTLISENDKWTISSLKISGELNGTDIRFIREMLGRDVNGNETNGKLISLDISNARIVAGGDYYYQHPKSKAEYHTEVDAVGECMFYECDKLKNIKLPQGLTAIKSTAFAYCHELRPLTIPTEVNTIGSHAFFYCTSMTSIHVHSKVTIIENNAFAACGILEIAVSDDNPNYTSVDGVLFSKDKTTLLQYAKDRILPDYTIPAYVTTIGGCAFYSADGLTSVVIPENVTVIEHAAFYACSSLKHIAIHGGVTEIHGQALGAGGSLYIDIAEDNPNYASIDGVLFSKDKKTLIQYSLHDVNPVYTIPDGVTTIGVNAFYACSSLKGVNIPNSVTVIESGSFYGCYDLTTITFPSSLTNLGDNIFGEDTPVSEIHCLATVPPVSNNSFNGLDIENCTLYIPTGSLDAYKSADSWKEFKTITEE